MDVISILSVGLAGIALVISVITYRGAVRAATRPVLVFSMTAPKLWQVTNVGVGPAVRLLVSDVDSDGTRHTITNCYPLAPGASHDLSWHKLGMGLVAQYEDIHGRVFTSECRHYENTLKITRRPDWACETEQWLQERKPENPSRPLLELSSLRGKSLWELDVLRAEPYARAGYAFSRADLREHYAQYDWYVARIDQQRDIEAAFTPEDEFDTRQVFQYQHRLGMDTRAGAL
jgi:hypothetical protein